MIFDYTGPLAGGGSDLHALGAKIMIDYFAKKGGVEGYAIEAVYADAQSKPDIAINEAVRLVEQEKVDMLLGFYSSAQCVPVAARVEQLKKFMWITTCISSAVLENRNLKYVFRAQPSGSQFGEMSMDFIEPPDLNDSLKFTAISGKFAVRTVASFPKTGRFLFPFCRNATCAMHCSGLISSGLENHSGRMTSAAVMRH